MPAFSSKYDSIACRLTTFILTGMGFRSVDLAFLYAVSIFSNLALFAGVFIMLSKIVKKSGFARFAATGKQGDFRLELPSPSEDRPPEFWKPVLKVISR
jgi:hypothetical protein